MGRYDAIGGVSPLAERTAAQVDALARRLEEVEPGRYRVAYGAKHTDPSIESAAAALAAQVDRVVGVVLTPHRSARGSGEYLSRARPTPSSPSGQGCPSPKSTSGTTPPAS